MDIVHATHLWEKYVTALACVLSTSCTMLQPERHLLTRLTRCAMQCIGTIHGAYFSLSLCSKDSTHQSLEGAQSPLPLLIKVLSKTQTSSHLQHSCPLPKHNTGSVSNHSHELSADLVLCQLARVSQSIDEDVGEALRVGGIHNLVSAKKVRLPV
jgi:hypothetical protein